MPVKFVRLILLLNILSLPVLRARAQGLQFKSEDSLLTQRTSYRVFNSHVPVFYGHLYISFDLSLWDNANLGYVFNLADKDVSYSLSYLYNNGAGSLNFNIDSRSNKLSIPLPATALQRNKWLKVKIALNLNQDNITIRIDSMVYRADSFGFRSRLPANLVFGKNQYYTEVPNMAIRNLEVGDDNETHFFPLNEWTGNEVHDSKGDLAGFVENPLWLINSAYFWKEVYTGSPSHVAGLNFNPADQRLFIFTRDSLITFDPASKRAEAAAYANKLPVNLVLGKSIVNTRENKCYVYELFDVAKGAPSVASLDLDKNNLRWNTVGRDALPYQRHHHNIFYDTGQHHIYLFGGYGSYSYHNNFLQYNDSLDKWTNTPFTGDPITPRFFSAIGPADSSGELLLFGGYGNESGKQIVGGKQYYDCYRLNLRTHAVKKCWQVAPPPGEVFVPANNLILSPDKQYFYALCYPHEQAHTELKLYKFALRDGSYEVVSAPIPMASMRIESDVNLFFSHTTGEFFCTIQEFADRNSSTIKVYSLSSPPIATTTYLASLHPVKKPNIVLLIAVLLPGLAAAGALTWFLRRRPKPTLGNIPTTTATPIPPPQPEQPVQSVQKNTIFLLGEFAAFDRKGNDISHLFSPKIKQLFLLILFNSMDGRGIISKKISAKLWPEKDPGKTKNIKGVTFNHLRSILSDIDGIELVFANDSYSFQITEPLFCDYWQVRQQLPNSRPDPATFQLVTRGPLLEDLSDPLLDEFKSDYECRLIAALTPHLKQSYDAGDYRHSLEIARILLSMDPFNEDVLKYQLRSYRRLKGIDYSRRAYDQFALDYERSLGVAYHTSFDKIVQ
ncbi:MAG TPA: hypothetical protein VGM89_19605 [Puia sp.]